MTLLELIECLACGPATALRSGSVLSIIHFRVGVFICWKIINERTFAHVNCSTPNQISFNNITQLFCILGSWTSVTHLEILLLRCYCFLPIQIGFSVTYVRNVIIIKLKVVVKLHSVSISSRCRDSILPSFSTYAVMMQLKTLHLPSLPFAGFPTRSCQSIIVR